MYIKGKFVSGQELSEIKELRRRCEANNQKGEEADGFDSMAIHGLAYCVEDESKPVSCGRLRYDGDSYTIDRLYSLAKESEEYSDFVLKMLIYQAVQHGAKAIEAHVFQEQIPLFQKNRFRLSYSEEAKQDGSFLMRLEHADENHCCK